ncbi:MAG TPA: site-specific integrase [Puia sp.]|nr:site-specific integrase [Puia sp.]
MELLDVRFIFLCRSTHINGEGHSPLVLRMIYRGQRKDIFTGLYCDKRDWDSSAQKVFAVEKNAAGLNKNLGLIIHKARRCFEELQFSGSTFSIDELADKIRGKEQVPVSLVEYIEQCNEKINRRVDVDITKGTFVKYRTCLMHIQDFLDREHKTRKFPLHSMDGKFLEKFFYYLRTEKNIAHNTAVKYMKSIRTLIYAAVKDGLIRRDPFADFKMKSKPVFREYLSLDEISQLQDALLESKDLDRIRDIFLFACYTGLAYSDIKQLRGTHIIQDRDQTWFIRKPRQKTGQESIIPLLPVAIRILQKYSLTSDIRSISWHVSANQKMNQRLKIIGSAARISKILHMHLARHTFATTITLTNGIPIETVSSMLGHASLKQTQHYAKIIAGKVKLEMAKINSLFS